VKEAIAI